MLQFESFEIIKLSHLKGAKKKGVLGLSLKLNFL